MPKCAIRNADENIQRWFLHSLLSCFTIWQWYKATGTVPDRVIGNIEENLQRWVLPSRRFSSFWTAWGFPGLLNLLFPDQCACRMLERICSFCCILFLGLLILLYPNQCVCERPKGIPFFQGLLFLVYSDRVCWWHAAVHSFTLHSVLVSMFWFLCFRQARPSLFMPVWQRHSTGVLPKLFLTNFLLNS